MKKRRLKRWAPHQTGFLLSKLQLNVVPTVRNR